MNRLNSSWLKTLLARSFSPRANATRKLPEGIMMTLATLNFAVKNVDHSKVFKVALKDIESKTAVAIAA